MFHQRILPLPKLGQCWHRRPCATTRVAHQGRLCLIQRRNGLLMGDWHEFHSNYSSCSWLPLPVSWWCSRLSRSRSDRTWLSLIRSYEIEAGGTKSRRQRRHLGCQDALEQVLGDSYQLTEMYLQFWSPSLILHSRGAQLTTLIIFSALNLTLL